MVTNKKKKSVRLRGSKTHGCGSMKKRRGAGNRGGRGMAGSGKRSDNRKPSIWKGRYFGKHGFKSKNTKIVDAVNLDYLEDNLARLDSEKLIVREGEFYSVDLEKLGFNKLLSSGKVENKYKIRVEYASKKAIEKVESKGGQVILPGKPNTDNTN